ncbi:MAG: peptidoglycan DD-metalloendopeptidase family protein [Candidatus Doudnabacteria bacterium]|nr:peptidoglycan DD-metalloendopeptidase family protein [Candidatus Doudnabacteria bacterium]
MRTQTGPHPTHTGYYYPVTDVNDWIDRGYHRIGGSSTKVQQGPSNTGYAGHFMSPDPVVNDYHTGQAGWYDYSPDVYHNGYDVMAPYGTYVYAAADGYIDQVSLNGWDVSGSTVNIALVIRSTSPTAGSFKAVYGHIEKSTCMYCGSGQLNTQVYKGQYLGSVGTYGGAEHLHFGIWVGSGSPTTGLGRTAIANWPSRMGWVDPIQFIESTCPPGDTSKCSDPDMPLSFYDMKQGLIAKFDKALVPYPNDLRWWWDDVAGNSIHYRSWFFKTVNGVTTWYEAEAAVDKTNKLIRWWGYYDVNGNWSGWKQVVVYP